jgi:hypothetical protein
MWLDNDMTTNETRPNLTSEVVDQLRAFNTGDIFPVIITKTVKSKAGNVIIAAGFETWGMKNDYNDGMSVWTGHTHYAGVKSSSVPAKNVKVAAAAC